MYQLFIVGIAYLNSLWQAAEQGWTIVPSYVEALLDMQVCTSVMSSLSGEFHTTPNRSRLKEAITPGLTSLCSAFESLSERIIRQLTSRASWSTISRVPSPDTQGADVHTGLQTTSAPAVQPRPHGDVDMFSFMQHDENTTLLPGTAAVLNPAQPGVSTAFVNFDDGSFNLDPSSHPLDQVNVGTFLADLGFGNEGPQGTFDNLFMESFPDFPANDWSWT